MDEDRLWQEYKRSGDERLKEQLVRKYLYLVKYVVGKMMMKIPPNIVEYEELISEGIIGLIEAINKYDIHKKVKFETYSLYRIRGQVLDYLRKRDILSRPLREKVKQIEDVYKKLEGELGRFPNDGEVADELNLEKEEFYKLMNKVSAIGLISLDEEIESKKGELLQLKESLANDKAKDVAASYEKKEIKKILIDHIKKLDDKEREVLALYYYEDLTLKEISKVMNLTEGRICQIHTKAIIKLRSALKGVI